MTSTDAADADDPSIAFRLAARHAPSLAALFWLAAFQGSMTSTVLRTAAVRNAGGFADTDSAEDWQLAARLARRGPFIPASTSPCASTTATPAQHASPATNQPLRRYATPCAATASPTPRPHPHIGSSPPSYAS